MLFICLRTDDDRFSNWIIYLWKIEYFICRIVYVRRFDDSTSLFSSVRASTFQISAFTLSSLALFLSFEYPSSGASDLHFLVIRLFSLGTFQLYLKVAMVAYISSCTF